MRKIKKALSCLVAVLLVLSAFPTAFTASAVYSGDCGDSLWWEYDPNTLTLTVSGSGRMENFYYTYTNDCRLLTTAPWERFFDTMQNVVIGPFVTEISQYAFAGCIALESVTAGESVMDISDFAFYDCINLSSVTLDNNVGRIGTVAFANCYALTSIIIPDRVLYIEDSAFIDCSGLSSVTIPAGVTRIGHNAFSGCPALADVYYNGTQEQWNAIQIGVNNAPLLGATLHTAPLPVDSGTCGDNLTWAYDPNTKTLTISGTGAMEPYSFETPAPWNAYADAIETVVIGDSVTSIGSHAFYNCSSITAITIPAGVTEIGDYPFLNCTALTDLTVAQDNAVFHSAGNCIIETAGKTLLYGCKNSVIPADGSVTSLGALAFYSCFGLTSLTIPDSVVSFSDSTFYNCAALTDLSIGNGITSIPASAFFGCGLTDVTIGSSVTTIGSNAFFGCSDLTNITIPVSVMSIGSYAFTYCADLANIYYGGTQQQWNAINIGDHNAPLQNATKHFAPLPVDSGACGDNLTWVYDPNTKTLTISGTGAMSNFGAATYDGHFITAAPWRTYYNTMETVVIENNVTSIGDCAFYGCPALTNLTISDTVTRIGDSAFFSCSGLTSLTIPNSVVSTGFYSFEGCTGLTGVTFGTGLTSINDYVFSTCTALTSVMIPDNITQLGSYSFYNCSNLASVTIGSSVTHIIEAAFYGCGNLTDIYYNGTQQQWNAITIDEDNAPLQDATKHFAPLPTVSGTCGTNLTWVYDPNTFTLTVSGTGAMYDYSIQNANGHFLTTAPWQDHHQNIQSVVINSGVTAIGAYAFCKCSAITDITIGGDVASIGYCAFSFCTALTNVTLPDSVIIIGGGAFSDCTALTSVNIPNNVTAIGEAAFCNCDRLTSVTIPDGAANIELSHHTFESCDSLTNVAIGNRVTSIGDATFLNCFRLTSVTIPDSVTSIDNYAFEGCSALTSVTIPDSVTSIGVGAFNYSGLTSVTIGSGVTSISEDLFAGCSALTSVTIPDSVTSIGVGAFYGCSALTGVTIPDSVTSIGVGAFNYSGLTSVTIPDSVTSIDYAAFEGCTGLADVYYTGTQQQWNAITIGENNDPLLNATLHLHEHTYTANVTTPATCTQDGVMTYTCACGDAYTEPIAATGHTPQTVVTVPAACTETGLQHEECAVCHERLGEDVVIPANGHTVGAWQMIEDPTPTSTGRMCQYCTVCRLLLDEMTVPMLAGTHVTGITLSNDEAYLNMGETLTLTADVTPASATDKTVLWTSTRPGVATVENGVVTPVAPGITVIIAQTVDNGYKDFCVVQVNAVSAQNGLVIDGGMIYGLSVNMSDLGDFLLLSDDTMTIETSTDVIGTGTIITVKQGGAIINEFEAVIFGDVDGNAWYDGTDAYFVYLIVSGMVSPDALSDAQRTACDANRDGVIDEADVALLEQAGLLLADIDQNATNEELQVNSVYLTYCGLIDQTIEITEPAADEEPQPAAQSVWSRVMALFTVILNWLLGMFKI